MQAADRNNDRNNYMFMLVGIVLLVVGILGAISSPGKAATLGRIQANDIAQVLVQEYIPECVTVYSPVNTKLTFRARYGKFAATLQTEQSRKLVYHIKAGRSYFCPLYFAPPTPQKQEVLTISMKHVHAYVEFPVEPQPARPS